MVIERNRIRQFSTSPHSHGVKVAVAYRVMRLLEFKFCRRAPMFSDQKRIYEMFSNRFHEITSILISAVVFTDVPL